MPPVWTWASETTPRSQRKAHEHRAAIELFVHFYQFYLNCINFKLRHLIPPNASHDAVLQFAEAVRLKFQIGFYDQIDHNLHFLEYHILLRLLRLRHCRGACHTSNAMSRDIREKAIGLVFARFFQSRFCEILCQFPRYFILWNCRNRLGRNTDSDLHALSDSARSKESYGLI
jgi:hypothetical protein